MENFLNRKDNLTNGNPGFFSQQFIQAELIMLEVLCMHVGESCPYIIHLCHSTWTQSSKYKGSTYWLVIGDIHLVNSTFWWLAMLKSNPTVCGIKIDLMIRNIQICFRLLGTIGTAMVGANQTKCTTYDFKGWTSCSVENGVKYKLQWSFKNRMNHLFRFGMRPCPRLDIVFLV